MFWSWPSAERQLREKKPDEGPRDRAQFDAVIEAMVEAAGVRYEPATVGGVPGWWCRPDGAQPGARLLFAHGGGYVLGSAFPFRKIAGQIAVRARADTFVVDYPLAPEHPFPAAIDASGDLRSRLTMVPAAGLGRALERWPLSV